MAYAASNFVESILKVLDGKRKIVECAFVESDVTLCPYFSSPFVLGVCLKVLQFACACGNKLNPRPS